MNTVLIPHNFIPKFLRVYNFIGEVRFFSVVHQFTLTVLNSCAVLLSNRSVSWGPSASLCPCGLSFLLLWKTAPSTSFITPLFFLSNCLLFNLYCLQFQVVNDMSCVWVQHSPSERKDLEELLHNISIPLAPFPVPHLSYILPVCIYSAEEKYMLFKEIALLAVLWKEHLDN